ncbi:MAG: hypothetical protein AB7I27_00465 [Bacteriovoracaceae bacterium]
MSKEDNISRMIEQLYLKLLAEIGSDEIGLILDDGKINLDTEDFEFEVKCKIKRKMVLIKQDD